MLVSIPSMSINKIAESKGRAVFVDILLFGAIC